MKKLQILYITAFFAACLVPSLGMAVTKQETSSENRQLSEFPKLKTEEGINIQWFPQAGEYFQEHFALRNEFVTANALLSGKVMGTSTADGVIQGTDGWLYYKDSLSDYLGEELLSERSLFNIAHTLSMMQENLESRGVKFLFTVAPNKNSLYGENMPYYDSMKVSGEKNLNNLQRYLEQEHVSYADLYGSFLQEEEVLYHKTDSHWNNKGAAMAAEILLSALRKDHASYVEEPYKVKKDFIGDLDEMLYPLATTPDEEIYYDKQPTFAYVGEVGSNFDPKITTVNPVKSGSLVMFRDSFGNALLPFMADAYANAYFSRGVPYQISEVDEKSADAVVVERAERFLPEMAQSPPVMEGPECDVTVTEDDAVLDGVVDMETQMMGNLVKIIGRVAKEYLDTNSRIYVRVNNDKIYEAFPMDISRENGNVDSSGFCLYLDSNKLAADGNQFEILTGDNNSVRIMGGLTL